MTCSHATFPLGLKTCYIILMRSYSIMLEPLNQCKFGYVFCQKMLYLLWKIKFIILRRGCVVHVVREWISACMCVRARAGTHACMCLCVCLYVCVSNCVWVCMCVRCVGVCHRTKINLRMVCAWITATWTTKMHLTALHWTWIHFIGDLCKHMNSSVCAANCSTCYNRQLFIIYFLCSNISDNISAMALKLGMTVDWYMAYHSTHVHFDDLDLDTTDHSGSPEVKMQQWIISTTKQIMSIKLATMVGHFYMTLTVTLKTFIWLDQVVIVYCLSSCSFCICDSSVILPISL